MNQSILFLLALLLHCWNLCAQNQVDSTQAKAVFDKGVGQLNNAQYEAAYQSLGKASLLYEQLEDWKHMIDASNSQAWARFWQGKLPEAEKILLKNLEVAIHKTGARSKTVSSTYYYLSAVAGRNTLYDQSLAYAQQGIDILMEHDPDDFRMGNFFNSQAIAYYEKRDFERALDLQKRALQIKFKHHPPVSTYIAKSYNNIGIIYRDLGQYDKALEYYQKSLDIKKQIHSGPHPQIAATLNNMAILYEDLGDYTRSLMLLEESLEIERLIFGEESYETADKYGVMATIFTRTGRYEEALKYNRKAFYTWQKGLIHNHSHLARATGQFGQIYLEQGLLDSALFYFHKEVRMLVPAFHEMDPLKNPPDQALNTISDLSDAFEGKAKALFALGQLAADDQLLLASLQAYEKAAAVIELTAQGYIGESSKLHLLDRSRPIFEGAIALCYALWERSADTRYIFQAFRFAERNKATVLRASLQAKKAIQYAGIPDSIQQKEISLKSQIESLSLASFQLADASQTDSLEKVNEELFEAKQQYIALLAQLEIDYPLYFELKYQQKAPSLVEIQQYLAQQPARLIAFFEGEEVLYSFSITATDINWHRTLKLDELQKTVSEISGFLYDNSSARAQAFDVALFANFAQHSFQLYQQTLGAYDISEGENLIIIPDGILHQVPFEVLLTAKPQTQIKAQYQALAYLIKSHPIRTIYSAHLMLSDKPRHAKTTAGLLAFAPSYETPSDELFSSRAGFSDLKFSAKEAQSIAEMTGGDAFFGEAANEARFRAIASKYKVIHLAMHAFTEEENPLYSGLLMQEKADSLHDNVLHAAELYNLEINADLAILSACNTGQGKLAQGEGVMSLARAFRQAGCPNIVMSLWQVDDEATQQIMQTFYEELQKGKGKDKALQLAKLTYLEKRRNVHPHFWSAFVLMGDAEPVDFDAPNPWSPFLLTGFLCLLGVLGFVHLRRNAPSW
ncbi:MAG: CHAT domain-containing tetratricopeptide repeat protein [Bacteroidota bacterium]